MSLAIDLDMLSFTSGLGVGTVSATSSISSCLSDSVALDSACVSSLGDFSSEAGVVEGSGERLLRMYCEAEDLDAGDEILSRVSAACSSTMSFRFPSTCWTDGSFLESGISCLFLDNDVFPFYFNMLDGWRFPGVGFIDADSSNRWPTCGFEAFNHSLFDLCRFFQRDGFRIRYRFINGSRLCGHILSTSPWFLGLN